MAYLFGCTRRKLSTEQVDLRERVARRHDAEFHYDDADGPSSWFSTENLGDPFDLHTAHLVEAALREADPDFHPWSEDIHWVYDGTKTITPNRS